MCRSCVAVWRIRYPKPGVVVCVLGSCLWDQVFGCVPVAPDRLVSAAVVDGCIRYVSDAGGESALSATSPSCSALWSGGGGVWVYGDLVVGTKAVGCEVAVVHPRVTTAVVGPRVGIGEVVRRTLDSD